MSEPTKQTIKKLFALSGNLCAYPGCSLPMVESSGTVTGQICHIHAQNEGGPRFKKSLSEKELHAFENLILMCGHHHKVIDAEEHIYTAESLRDLKQIHEETAGRAERPEDAFYAQVLLNAYHISVGSNTGNLAINSPGAIQGNTITVNTKKKSVNIQAPLGTIGSNIVLSKYISHLIKRYNEYASKETSRKSKFSYGAISKNISDKFGSKWQLLEEGRANEIISYMHTRILRTRQARINKGKGYPSFSSLEEYQKKYGAKGI